MATLESVLEEAKELGFLGPGPVAGHIEHSAGYVQAVGDQVPRRVVDLGSGGGVPGLVVASAWPEAIICLLDSNERRALFLARAAAALGLTNRVVVGHARAEDAGRDPAWRGHADLVLARSFAPPGVTAECAAPLLAVDGRLIVSEPPGTPGDRWPEASLARLGLRPVGRFEQSFSRFQILRQERLCPDEYPRKVGMPGKRPLF